MAELSLVIFSLAIIFINVLIPVAIRKRNSFLGSAINCCSLVPVRFAVASLIYALFPSQYAIWIAIAIYLIELIVFKLFFVAIIKSVEYYLDYLAMYVLLFAIINLSGNVQQTIPVAFLFAAALGTVKILQIYSPVKQFNVSDVKLSIPAIIAALITVVPFSIFYELSIKGNFVVPGTLWFVILTVTIIILDKRGELLKTLPLLILFCLSTYIFGNYNENATIIGFLAGIVIFIFSAELKFLTLSGGMLTLSFAIIVYGLGGLKWSIPLVAFFLFSSILSKVKRKVNPVQDKVSDKNSVRDYMQVMANGGIAVLIIIINSFESNDLWYFAFLTSLATVCADTWSTEIGTMWRVKTYNILTFKQAKQGISGGISLPGSIGAVLGSLIIVLSALNWINIEQWDVIFLILGFGILGSFADSLYGATIQLQNKCSQCGNITEKVVHCGYLTDYFRGIRWIRNDIVNLIASLTGAALFLLFYSFIKV